MERLFSGIQPTGDIHIGNYLGALSNWVKLQDQYECIFSVVDYHAITITYDVKIMPENIMNMAITLLAVGIDPEKSTIFRQSHVTEHTELAWIFNTVTPLGDLNRMTQFKDKAKQHRHNVNMALYDYPVLQAADILLYKAVKVPIGEDQIQHIELTREIARYFNLRYGPVFSPPAWILSETPRIMGIDGKRKMSKSLNNHISLLDSKNDMMAKLKRAYTDENRKRREDPGNPDICNIFTMHRCFSTEDQIDRINRECRKAGIGCGECKLLLCDNMYAHIEPIQKRYQEFKQNPGYIFKTLEKGRERCQEIAKKTLLEVKAAMGLS